MSKQLVTIEERRWIAENAIIEMGSKIKYRVMDIDKVVERISEQRKAHAMTPWIEIQPISADMHKMPNRLATFQKDPVFGTLYGIAVDQDEFGNIRWQKIQLHDHLSLNMDKRNDARIWAAIRFHPDIQGSPFQTDNPYYKIFDPVEQAQIEIGEVEAIKIAFGRIDKILDDAKAMVHFSRFLGEDLMENANYRIVRGKLLNFARNHPFDFNKKWESKARSYAEHFFSASALGVITNEPDKGYMFKGIPLGLTSAEAIAYLSKDQNIMNSIVTELSDKDSVVKSVSQSVNDEVKSKKVTTEDFE